jgi:TRAP-type C4-dicarboxylate transport system substrate-binding protein
MSNLAALVTLLLAGSVAFAEPAVLRFSTVAPDGTAWARELRDFQRDVETRTHGEVKVKLYFAGVTGDDFEALGRIQKGTLEGVASASMLCEHLAPSMRALRLLGVFNSREESDYVRGRLADVFDAEFKRAGFVNLGFTGIGAVRLFSRVPLRTLADVKRARLWVWDIDRLGRMYAEALGLTPITLPIEKVRAALEDGRVDAFFAVPSAVLAYRWHPRLRYLVDVNTAYLTGCLVMDARALDRLPLEAQGAVRGAATQLAARLDHVGGAVEDTTLGTLRKQGLQLIPVPESIRNELFDEYRRARERMSEPLVPSPLVRRVVSLLTAFRSQSAKTP